MCLCSQVHLSVLLSSNSLSCLLTNRSFGMRLAVLFGPLDCVGAVGSNDRHAQRTSMHRKTASMVHDLVAKIRQCQQARLDLRGTRSSNIGIVCNERRVPAQKLVPIHERGNRVGRKQSILEQQIESQPTSVVTTIKARIAKLQSEIGDDHPRSAHLRELLS